MQGNIFNSIIIAQEIDDKAVGSALTSEALGHGNQPLSLLLGLRTAREINKALNRAHRTGFEEGQRAPIKIRRPKNPIGVLSEGDPRPEIESRLNELIENVKAMSDNNILNIKSFEKAAESALRLKKSSDK